MRVANSLDYWLINSQVEETQGARNGEKAWRSHALPEGFTLPKPLRVHQPRSSGILPLSLSFQKKSKHALSFVALRPFGHSSEHLGCLVIFICWFVHLPPRHCALLKGKDCVFYLLYRRGSFKCHLTRSPRVACGMGGWEGSKPVALTAFWGLAIVSWKWMWLSGVKREEIIIKAKHFICVSSHLIHYLLGNKYYYFVNMANWNFNEVKWLDQQGVSFQNPSSSSKHRNVYDAAVWTKTFKTRSRRN